MLSNRLICGELSNESVSDALRGNLPDVVYSDPPWGGGNLKYWRTKNGESVRPSWANFVDNFVSAISKCKGWVFVEMGLRWADEVSKHISASGFVLRHKHEMDYGSPPRPNMLLAFNRTDEFPSIILPRWGWDATAKIAAQFAISGGILLDPCVGLGKSASLFASRGMIVCGIELNPKRITQARKRLAC